MRPEGEGGEQLCTIIPYMTVILTAGVCLQTLTPLQGARLLVKSFPWYPDIPAVCIWLSALAGNRAALSELRRLLPDETIEPPAA